LGEKIGGTPPSPPKSSGFSSWFQIYSFLFQQFCWWVMKYPIHLR
jgi:hypothetical protein